MTTVAMNAAQQALLQNEVQLELEKREWAEPGDNVMAEYITVLITNGSDRERVQKEMDDLVGADFDPGFLTWLFEHASEIQQMPVSTSPSSPVATGLPAQTSGPHSTPGSTLQSPPQRTPAAAGSGRILSSALSASRQDSYKRKADIHAPDGPSKKRLSDHGLAVPSGPRAMGAEGRSLQSRLSGRAPGSLQVRGVAAVPPRPMGMAGNGIQGMQGVQGMQMQGMPGMGMSGGRPMMQPAQPNQTFPGFFQQPGQQEMMAQMMMMQANMAQMGEMMTHMMEEKQKAQQANAQTQTKAYTPEKPPRPVKVPLGTKLGAHSVSAVTPKATAGPIPAKPSSTSLCKYSVGCTNTRCIYSHPSPVADDKTGMVLSEEACAEGKDCKDAECIKSHVSPAVVHGGKAGPSKLLCKYQNCTNPSCAFRHEDADGNPIPPPALSKTPAMPTISTAPLPAYQPSSDNEDGDIEVVMTSKSLLDGPLDDSKPTVACRFGERCTRPDCKFSHPPSRVAPRGRGGFSGRGAARGGASGIGGGMSKSKKFGSTASVSNRNGSAPQPPVEVKPLNPVAGEFVPGEAVAQ